MTPLTKEWVAKAEDDYEVALTEYRKRKSPKYDAACFHAQQCAEKYLKARLNEASIAFSKTHNLTKLLQLVLPIEPLWSGMLNSLSELTTSAVEYRYPGKSASKDDVKQAIATAKEMRALARQSLGI